MGNTRTGREVESALRKKGFVVKSDGKHIRFYLLGEQGEKTGIATLISHGMGGQAIGADLITQMARQLHLTKRQFLNFIDCTVSEMEYREILRGQNDITPSD